MEGAMSLWDLIKGGFSQDNQQFISFPIDKGRTDDEPQPTAIEANKTYFRLRVASMFLRKRVKGAKSWYPALHSVVRITLGDQNAVDIPSITDPSIGNMKGNGNILLRDLVLTSALPFSGGTISISAGLVAVEEENKLNKFIQVFGGFADLLAVPQLSSVLQIAKPLAFGIQELFTSGNGQIHIGLKQDFAGGELKQGYVAVIRATETQIDKARLFVVDKQLRTGDSLTKNDPFETFDHMVLRVEVFTDRDDYDKLSFIKDPFEEALNALPIDDDPASVKKADMFMQTALRRVLQSPDLTQADRRRVVDLLKAQYRIAKEGLRGGVGRDVSLPVLLRSMSVDQAAARGEPTVDDILDL
jgi:hypothetical protein